MRDEIEAQLQRLRQPLAELAPSELSFANLYLFRAVRGWRYHPHPRPHIAGRSYDDSRQLLPLFDITTADRQILREMQGKDGWFCPISPGAIESFDRADCEVITRRDDADYLYEAESFRQYAGAGLGAKRTAVEHLRAAHALHTLPLDAECLQATLGVLAAWCDEKGFSAEGADAPSCRETLAGLCSNDECGGSPSRIFESLFGYLHLVDERPAGFVIAEELNPGVLVVRFSKGLRDYDGIFPTMYQHLANSTSRPVNWLNFEQDLGRPNFRRSKLSFRPIQLLPKPRLRLLD